MLYGNKGNDFLEDFDGRGAFSGAAQNNGAAEGNSALYGGAGNDTMLAILAGGDSMAGGTGVNLFAANDLISNNSGLEFNFFNVNDLITVEDYNANASINDYVSMSRNFSATTNFFDQGFLLKIDDPNANAADALSAANVQFSIRNAFAGTNSAEYVFVYGGTGAGYLFYNGDRGGAAAVDGMTLVGQNSESSIDPSARPTGRGCCAVFPWRGEKGGSRPCPTERGRELSAEVQRCPLRDASSATVRRYGGRSMEPSSRRARRHIDEGRRPCTLSASGLVASGSRSASCRSVMLGAE